MSKYFPPTYGSDQFHCPYCHVYASQYWTEIFSPAKLPSNYQTQPILIEEHRVTLSYCSHCYEPTLWIDKKIIYPLIGMFPLANEDLPDDVKEIYNEAASVANQSCRAACALLRLALQMLLEQLGRSGNINDDIKNLVKKGLNLQIQQALDIVRVTGNHAVHPGEIVFDDTTNVQVLFDLLNIIADVFITQPKRTQKLYDNLPETDKEKIAKRDGKTK